MAMSYTRGYGTDALIRSLYARRAILEDDMGDVARKGAEAVKDLSVAYSPVDEGHLEDAHKVVFRSTRRDNVAFDVIVDESEADLHLYLHEINTGNYNLGPLSEQKAQLTGQPVGPKFLERAFDKLRPDIVQEYKQVVRRFTR